MAIPNHNPNPLKKKSSSARTADVGTADVVGSDRKREKKADKAQTKEVKVSKFDGRFLNDTIFSRKQKEDKVEVQEVFAIEKGAPITWIRGRKDRFIVTQKDTVESVSGGDVHQTSR